MLCNPAAAAHFGLSLEEKILPLVRPQAKTGLMGASGLPKLPLRESTQLCPKDAQQQRKRA